MKNILLLALLLVFGVANSQEIKWMTMNEAIAAQKKEPKKIFMDVYTTWCGPCKMLDKNTFSDKNVAAYVNKHYYAVKFDAEGTEEIDYQDFVYTNPNYDPARKGRNSQHLFAHAMKVTAYPTVVFFKDNGDIIQAVPGYRTPPQLELFLKMIQSDDYLKVTTAEAWEEYQKNFKPTF
ncbi:thioredoxin-related protein [Aequorivita sublithincola DSM 14238]|uniref:Thioredoxin-related protein n=1 Tax=Aequorivita sublithincola (strain DSM 14238 / LMG 21431 / ACAM 643 / 9-3) TaxID=746697 RepID=I3YWP8_AEQSU|nr:thioredoxin fold domain-containing protein [Aequorivita sublithincola]AFL81416.1 thioredoxin-related protein [Aequorivita sublithincola DSM 14238]